MRGPITATKDGPQLGNWGAEAGLVAQRVGAHRAPAVRHLLRTEERRQSPAGRCRPCRREGAKRSIDVHTELSEANPAREWGGSPWRIGRHRRNRRVHVKRHGSTSSQRTSTHIRRAPWCGGRRCRRDARRKRRGLVCGSGRCGGQQRQRRRRDCWYGRSRGSRSRRGCARGRRRIATNCDGIPMGAPAQRGASRIEGRTGVAGKYSEERGRGSRSRCQQGVLERARRQVERICTSKVLWREALALQEGRGQELHLLREQLNSSHAQRLQAALLRRGNRCEEPVAKGDYVW